MKKSRLQELAGIDPKATFPGTWGTRTLNESFEEEASNLISSQAGTIMTMRQDSDKASMYQFDQALENLVAAQVESGYSNDAIYGFFNSLVRDAIESVEGEKEGQEELQEADAKVIPSTRRKGQSDIQMTVTFENAVQYFQESAEEMGMSVDFNDASTEQKLANLMQEDLEIWLGNNGAQWLEDGIDGGAYDDLDTGLGSR